MIYGKSATTTESPSSRHAQIENYLDAGDVELHSEKTSLCQRLRISRSQSDCDQLQIVWMQFLGVVGTSLVVNPLNLRSCKVTTHDYQQTAKVTVVSTPSNCRACLLQKEIASAVVLSRFPLTVRVAFAKNGLLCLLNKCMQCQRRCWNVLGHLESW